MLPFALIYLISTDQISRIKSYDVSTFTFLSLLSSDTHQVIQDMSIKFSKLLECLKASLDLNLYALLVRHPINSHNDNSNIAD